MATTSVPINKTYTLITSASEFTAQNVSGRKQEWVRAASLPAETVKGLIIKDEHGLDSSIGAGSLYGRGFGSVVFIS